MTELFKLDVPACGMAGAGSIVVTSPTDRVYLLTFSAPPDNRLTTALVQAFLLALDIIELRYPIGVVISTSAIPKFYSNGLDLDHVNATPGFKDESFFKLERRLSTYPMPTVALLNGHAFAGGLIVAMHHDYRIMNPSKGYLCMNEVDFGAVLDSPFLAIFREKVSATVFRDLILEARRYTSQQALEVGMIDGLGGLKETLDFVKSRNLTQKAQSGVYGAIKDDMWRHTISLTDSSRINQRWRHIIEAEKEAERNKAADRIVTWEGAGKSKL